MAAINIAKNNLGMEEDDYRSLLQRVTGKASLRIMTSVEHGRVLEELHAKGAPKPQAKGLPGPYGEKLKALWLSGWNLGLVRNRADQALLAFVKGQTGIDHTRFLRAAADARKAVEALKKWLERDAAVDWSEFTDPQDCVIAAQCRLLQVERQDIGYTVSGDPGAGAAGAIEAMAKVALMQILGERIRAQKAGA